MNATSPAAETPDNINRQTQRELYGEPIADIVGRITSALGLTQGRLAEVIGLSAPMLSQLVSARRVKIGNPAVLARLQSLADLAVGPALSLEEREARLAAIHDEQPTMSTMRDAGAVHALRAAAPSEELQRLAQQTTAPELAALLRLAAGPSSHG
ncbi:helix-turn-helix domain-containing protein [Tessaracoccus flavus]|uniref:Uncharacterized protein n=1 Tax=Tessaracoccus flavus TaxID=1610493 RepID=A0A1Q2CF52_9ACTN|nr:hypothetical protein [Tessaracoccus flavus]AQP44733.1 hypothetical protein RPIT_07875 [Tessaracoccus flavus]SDZ16298.1 hypothetical protein SAMN05428934_11315 [Tessaracoccus flavus]